MQKKKVWNFCQSSNLDFCSASIGESVVDFGKTVVKNFRLSRTVDSCGGRCINMIRVFRDMDLLRVSNCTSFFHLIKHATGRWFITIYKHFRELLNVRVYEQMAILLCASFWKRSTLDVQLQEVFSNRKCARVSWRLKFFAKISKLRSVVYRGFRTLIL